MTRVADPFPWAEVAASRYVRGFALFVGVCFMAAGAFDVTRVSARARRVCHDRRSAFGPLIVGHTLEVGVAPSLGDTPHETVGLGALHRAALGLHLFKDPTRAVMITHLDVRAGEVELGIHGVDVVA